MNKVLIAFSCRIALARTSNTFYYTSLKIIWGDVISNYKVGFRFQVKVPSIPGLRRIFYHELMLTCNIYFSAFNDMVIFSLLLCYYLT